MNYTINNEILKKTRKYNITKDLPSITDAVKISRELFAREIYDSVGKPNPPVDIESIELTTEKGMNYITIEMSSSFAHTKWIGPKEGTQEVHQRVVNPEVVKDFCQYQREYQRCIMFVKELVPGAIVRKGCNCCYGDGPDIEVARDIHPDGSVILRFFVNFKRGD